ncbi:M23 family metallopeptidase [Erysipelothrix sp. HDW6A]|nr:M23 family metallopeptidase [Erysipelothrix sp. HDW6A]QIK57022.1 M23 family metallopeptidase [Erysipelothrix sp. HDW6A]
MKQKVGYLGHTGRSTGPHVHIEFMENNERFNPELVFSFD